jgi:hypothetical protein
MYAESYFTTYSSKYEALQNPTWVDKICRELFMMPETDRSDLVKCKLIPKYDQYMYISNKP